MRYAHTNIAAKNWRLLSEFYINVFDCKVKPPERNLSGSWLDRATGLKNASLEGVHLLLPGYGDNGPTIEIFSYQEMHDRALVMANHAGLTHIAFDVDDVEHTLAEAIKNGGADFGQSH